MMMWIPRRLDMKRRTSAQDWHVLLLELDTRVVEALRSENPFGWLPR
jgi:hypothetical protein